MNKTKILAFAAIAAMLAACGSDDGSPPELVKSYPNLISPFDTLVVKFNSNLVDIDTSNFVLKHGKIISGKTTGKELRFIGTDTTRGGWHCFGGGYCLDDIEGINDSIVFNKLKNSDGYIKDRTVFYFSTLPVFDKEPNDSEISASNIDRETAKKGDGTKFAGILNHRSGVTEIGQTIYDVEDYYTFKLKAADTVSITIENREPLEILVKGPKGTAYKTFQAAKGKSNVFTYIVGLEYLLEDPTLTANDLVSFYINVTDNATTSPPNPYTIRIKITEKK
jgi:hypothetical protein